VESGYIRYRERRPERCTTRLVFLARLLSASGLYSYDTTVVPEQAAGELGQSARAQLRDYECSHPDDYRAFLARPHVAPDLIDEVPLSPPREAILTLSQRFVQTLAAGLTWLELQAALDQEPVGSFRGGLPVRAMLRLVCQEYELRDHEFVYRRAVIARRGA